MTAMMKRIATNEIGGRSRRPNLIASQVELQMRQSATKRGDRREFTSLFRHRLAAHQLAPLQLLSASRQTLFRSRALSPNHSPAILATASARVSKVSSFISGP